VPLVPDSGGATTKRLIYEHACVWVTLLQRHFFAIDNYFRHLHFHLTYFLANSPEDETEPGSQKRRFSVSAD